MPNSAALKKPTNLTLDKALLAEAKELKVNISKAAEIGLRQEVANAKAALWRQENASAIDSSNQWIEKHGLPLDPYRQF